MFGGTAYGSPSAPEGGAEPRGGAPEGGKGVGRALRGGVRAFRAS